MKNVINCIDCNLLHIFIWRRMLYFIEVLRISFSDSHLIAEKAFFLITLITFLIFVRINFYIYFKHKKYFKNESTQLYL